MSPFSPSPARGLGMELDGIKGCKTRHVARKEEEEEDDDGR